MRGKWAAGRDGARYVGRGVNKQHVCRGLFKWVRELGSGKDRTVGVGGGKRSVCLVREGREVKERCEGIRGAREDLSIYDRVF